MPFFGQHLQYGLHFYVNSPLLPCHHFSLASSPQWPPSAQVSWRANPGQHCWGRWVTHCERSREALDLARMPRCAGVAAAQWLSLRLQLLAAAVVVLVAAVGIAGASGLLPAFASQAQG